MVRLFVAFVGFVLVQPAGALGGETIGFPFQRPPPLSKGGGSTSPSDQGVARFAPARGPQDPRPSLTSRRYEVLFETSFENGLGLWTAAFKFAVTDQVARTGTHAGYATETGTYAGLDTGALQTDATVEAWFLDSGQPKAEAWLVVARVLETLPWNNVWVGLDTNVSPTVYVYGFHTQGVGFGIKTSIQRSAGWHRLRIATDGTQNTVSLDDTVVYRTARQAGWRYLLLLESTVIPGQHDRTYWDEVRVTTGTVGVELTTWSAVKELFR